MPFLIAKALSFLPFGNFLRGTSLKIIIFLIIIGAISFTWYKYKESIRDTIVNQVQINRIVDINTKNNKNFEKLQSDLEARDHLILELLDKNAILIEALNEIRDKISAIEDESPVPDSIRAAIEGLYQIYNNSSEREEK